MGWVRSRAWIWLFSSTHSTTAPSGGLRYSPTTSEIFRSSSGSVENLKVSVRWGFKPWARQTRVTVTWDTRRRRPSRREDQWVTPSFWGAPAGGAPTPRSPGGGGGAGGGPPRGWPPAPDGRAVAKQSRH